MQWPKMNAQETAYENLLDKLAPVFNSIEMIAQEIEILNDKSQASSGFGYCPACNDLTPYRGWYALDYNRTECLKCRKSFGWGWIGKISSLSYLKGNDIPASLQEKAKICNSKNFQIDLLLCALKEIARDKKFELLKIQKEFGQAMTKIERAEEHLSQIKQD